MLRRRSEFFVFLDGMRSKPEEEQKEERPQSACEEYLQVLLQMKTTSSVSQQDLLMLNRFNAFSKQLNPSTFSECVTDPPSSHCDSQLRSNFLLLTFCNKDMLAYVVTRPPYLLCIMLHRIAERLGWWGDTAELLKQRGGGGVIGNKGITSAQANGTRILKFQSGRGVVSINIRAAHA